MKRVFFLSEKPAAETGGRVCSCSEGALQTLERLVIYLVLHDIK